MAVRYIFLLVVGTLFIYALYTKKERAFFLYIIAAPLSYFAVNVGVVLSPAKLIAVLFFIHWIFIKKLILPRNEFLKRFYTYFFYLILSTLIFSAFWPEYNTFEQSIFYTASFRGLVQIFLLAIQVVMIAVIVELGPKIDIHRIMILYCWVLLVICGYGLYVYFAQLYSLPFTGVNRQGMGESGTAISFRFSDEIIYRAYSLTGEPKQLAIDAILGLLLWHRFYFEIHRPNSFFVRLIIYSIFISSLFLTYSTSGYIIATLLFFALLTFTNVKKVKILYTFIGAIVGLSLLIPTNDEISSKIIGLMEYRVNDRIEEESIAGYAEDAALSVVMNYPVLAVTGVGLGGSSFYIRKFNRAQYAGYTAAPRGIIGIILDQGIIGIFLLGRAIYYAFKDMNRVKDFSVYTYKWKHLLKSILISFIVFQCTITHWYLFIGLLSIILLGIDNVLHNSKAEIYGNK